MQYMSIHIYIHGYINIVDYVMLHFSKERVDPRENANFFVDAKDPEFWNNAARKPYAKAITNNMYYIV